jgi:hypothetical protein
LLSCTTVLAVSVHSLTKLLIWQVGFWEGCGWWAEFCYCSSQAPRPPCWTWCGDGVLSLQ